MKFLIPCLASFLLTAVLTPLVIRIATACNCLDIPGERRLHKKITPRWGGVAFFAGVLPFLLIENGNNALTPFIAASCLLVGMGMIDDLRSLDWTIKFPVMAAAATIVIFGGDITVHHIGIYGSIGRVGLGWMSIPFTYVSIIGITNAINLLDGLNGLAGGVSLLGFLFMGIAALLSGNIMVAVICFAFVGALCAFLLFNFPNARIFMGDSGSIFLGFSLAITAMLLTQDATSSVDSMFPALVLLVPIFDTLRVLIVRIANGKNPFKADSLHLHYLIMQKNVSPVHVTLLFWSLTTVFGVFALSLMHRSSLSYLAVVLYSSLFLCLFAVRMAQKQQNQEDGYATTSLSADVEADLGGLTRHYINNNPGFARKGGMMIAIKGIVVLGVLLLAVQVFAVETPGLKTLMEKQSYGLGVDMGKNLKRQGTEMDPEIVLKGLKDAMKGDKLLMTDEELMVTMKNFAADRRAKQQKDKPAKQEDLTKIEDMDTIYAIGLILYGQLSDFNLTTGELQLVKQGLTHASTGNGPPDFDVKTYTEKINELARARRKALGLKLADMNRDFLEKTAKEKGAIKSDSGLVYLSLKDGSGANPKPTDTVKVNYRGTFPDGKEFDSSYKRGEPFEMKLDGVIKCWNEGLQKMKPGGKAELVCPPDLAYGEAGAGNLILPYATLVFEVELLEVKQ